MADSSPASGPRLPDQGRGLRPPRLPDALLLRPSLQRRLDDLNAVTLIEGLPGQGKTTLAAMWVRTLEHRAGVCWVTAAPEVDDASAMMEAVAAGMSLIGRREDEPDADSDPGETALDKVRFALLWSTAPVIVVVDAVERLTSFAAIDELVGLARSHANLHLVICGRDASIARAASRRHGVVVETITGAELMLSDGELRELAELCGRDASDEAIGEIRAEVGGWIQPVRLVLDASVGDPIEVRTHTARQFLDRVVDDLVGRKSLVVSMRMSLPDRIDEELADSLLSAGPEPCVVPSSGALAIAELERSGVLSPVEPGSGHAAWSYASEVRDVLLHRFERDFPDVAAECHRLVARSLWSRGGPSSVGPTLVHARKGGDWTLLARAWLSVRWQLAVLDLPAFTAAFSQLPAEVVAELPVLRLPRRVAESLAEAAKGSADVSLVKRHYYLAGAAMMSELTESTDLDERLGVLMAGMEASRAAGRIDQAHRIAAQMETLAAPRATRSDDREWWLAAPSVWWHFQTGVTHLLSGDLLPSMESLATAFEVRPHGMVAPQAAALMALIHVLNGSRDDALECLRTTEGHSWHGPELAQLTALPTAVSRAMLAMDQLDASAARHALLSIDGAYAREELWLTVVMARTRYEILFGHPVEMLNELEHLASHRTRRLELDPVGRRFLDRCRADLLLAMGQANLVRSIVGDGRDTPAWLRKTAAHLYLILGDHARADRIASTGMWAPDAVHRDAASLLMIRAASAFAQGQEREAGDTFRRGHFLAQHSGNLEPYLYLLPATRIQLANAAGVTLPSDQAQALARTPSPYPDSATLVELSPRELEVLVRLRHSGSLGTIARSLSVSINTVKKQVSSAYGKLGVHDRVSALHRAEQLGLLGDSSNEDSA